MCRGKSAEGRHSRGRGQNVLVEDRKQLTGGGTVMAARILPLVGVTLFFGVGIVWRACPQYRRQGHTGIPLFRSGSWVQWVGEGGFCLILLAIVAQPVVFAVSPQALSLAQIIVPAPWVVWAGTLVLVVGVIFMVAAQLGMG